MAKTLPISRPDLSSMAASWPSPLIARGEVERFTGGIISTKYIANMDSKGTGPSGRIRCGRKVAYPVKELVAWLENRAETL